MDYEGYLEKYEKLRLKRNDLPKIDLELAQSLFPTEEDFYISLHRFCEWFNIPYSSL